MEINKMVQVRIISADFYMSPPIGGLDCMYSEFRGCSVHQVPIIRIFGTTSTGKKTCLHVHGVFPYIYIPYDGKDPPDGMMYQIAVNLDKAINISLGQSSSGAQHVYKVLLVSGVPFYGYHKREHQFFKLYFYNPLIMKKACTLLQNGVVSGRIFQPHEAHIPYILQFMIDYNLHGMSFINLTQIKYRFESARDSDVPPDLISPPNLAKQSVCEVEADAFAQHILNQLDVAEGKLTANPGIKALWEDEKQRRRNKDEESQISPCLTQTRNNVPPTATHIVFKGVLEERLKAVDFDKENARNEGETSVYPAETPSTQSLLNASCIENHVPSNQSSGDTLITANSSVALDEDAQCLLELLKSLRNNVDKDSILSQVQKDNDSEEEQEEMDLSHPLGSVQTPKKTEAYTSKTSGNDDSDPDEFNDSYFDATVCIPQLDGSNEVGSSQQKKKKKKKRSAWQNPLRSSYDLRSRKINGDECEELLKLPDEGTKFKEGNVISGKQISSKLIQDHPVGVADANRNSFSTSESLSQIAQNFCSNVKVVDRNSSERTNLMTSDDGTGFININDGDHPSVSLDARNNVLKTEIREVNKKQLVVELVDIGKSFKNLIQPFKADVNPELERLSGKNLRPEGVNFLTVPDSEKEKGRKSRAKGKNKVEKNADEIRTPKSGKTRKQKARKKLRLDLSSLFNKASHNCSRNGGRKQLGKKSSPVLEGATQNTKIKICDRNDEEALKVKLERGKVAENVTTSGVVETKRNKTSEAAGRKCSELDTTKAKNDGAFQIKIDENFCFEAETYDLRPDWLQQFTKCETYVDNNLVVSGESQGCKSKKRDVRLEKINNNNNNDCRKNKKQTSCAGVASKKREVTSSRKVKDRSDLEKKIKDGPPSKKKKSRRVKNKARTENFTKDVGKINIWKKFRNGFIKPKFNVVPAPRPYYYSSKFNKKTDADATYVKILRNYPNAVWSFCEASSKKVSNLNVDATRTQKDGDLFVMSDYQPGRDEEIDPPVKNCNVTGANINENLFRGFSKDAEIISELSSLYDEIEMYSANFCKQGALVTPEKNKFDCVDSSAEELPGDVPEFDFFDEFQADGAPEGNVAFDELPNSGDIFGNSPQTNPACRWKKSSPSRGKTRPDNNESGGVAPRETKKEESGRTDFVKFDVVNYVKELGEKYESILDGQEQGWKEFYRSLRPITENSHVSMRLILERVRARERKNEGRNLIQNRTRKAEKRVSFRESPDDLKAASKNRNDHFCLNNCIVKENDRFDATNSDDKRFCLNQRNETSEEGHCSSSFNFKRPTKTQNVEQRRTDFQLRFLDGTNDGSSSEEEEEVDWRRATKKTQHTSPKKFTSQPATREYTPLTVTFGSPSKSKNSLGSRGLQDQINEMSSIKLSKNAGEKSADGLKKAPRKNGDNSRTKKHRRSLTFAEIEIAAPLDGTVVVDETVVCRCTPAKTIGQKQVISKTIGVKNEKNSKTKNKTEETAVEMCGEETEGAIDAKRESDGAVGEPSKAQIAINPKSTASQNSNTSAQYSDDLFSPETDPTNDADALNDAKNSEMVSTGTSKELTPYQRENKNAVSDLTGTLTEYVEIEDSEAPRAECGLIASVPKYNPPTRATVESTLADYDIPEVRHEEPFYGDCEDVTGNVEVGNSVLKIPSRAPVDQIEFETSAAKGIEFYNRRAVESLALKKNLSRKEIRDYKLTLFKDRDCVITPAFPPPTRNEVDTWLETKRGEARRDETSVQKERIKIRVPRSPNAQDDDDSCESLSISPCTPSDAAVKSLESEIVRGESPVIKKNKALVKRRRRHQEIKNDERRNSCRISGASFDNTHNFAVSSNNLQEAKVIVDHQYISVLSMEVHVQTRADFEPDPQLDPVRAIFYSLHRDAPDSDVLSGAFAVDFLPHSPTKSSILQGTGVDARVKLVDSETKLLDEFVAFVKDCDPDVLIGYEIETRSWGYLVERGYVLEMNLVSALSKVPVDTVMLGKGGGEEKAELRLTGRIVVDFWRLMRHEIALQSYTFENVVYHVLHRRVPLHSHKELSFWWNHPTAVLRHRTINYYLFRVRAVLKIIERLDLINRTSELARLFGVQFYEVLSRGSQFRVESMMLRLAKPLNYIAVSPGVHQRAKMRAPESLPLIMEPESKFYADPVVVLDFQSLYPSMMIAYNYCFSTCLGRIEHLGRNAPFEFGASQLRLSKRRVGKLLERDALNFSPCGVAFVKSEVRQGILPRMLREILSTRLMVKKSMKENAGDKVLQKVLHARQLGLKLIANVTYGYTAANFSGRMPAIEVADSVVSKGRETLQRAIKLVEGNDEWGARVVYGDTDSLFVLIAGRSREEAFRIGGEIADAVTDDNPSPVKLKLEKVFHPCVLQTKKRYVGYMYESPDQKGPEFCAKGIETVRRDGCPAVAKMLEKCLKMLFDTRDVSVIRKYVIRQFSKVLTGRVSIQDLTFAKEYRGASGYRPGACVPALELARKWTAQDKRKEPRSGERVPYVIINGPPGLPLIRLVRSPRELLRDPSLRPNAIYYITKAIIPAINRCFNLLGVDLNVWFNAMPRKQIQYLPSSTPTKGKKSTISQYFSSTSCALCGQQTPSGLCATCEAKTQESAVLLHEKLRIWERNDFETKLVCQSCCGRTEDLSCISLDCPVLYRRAQTEKDLQQSTFVRHLISCLPESEYY